MRTRVTTTFPYTTLFRSLSGGSHGLFVQTFSGPGHVLMHQARIRGAIADQVAVGTCFCAKACVKLRRNRSGPQHADVRSEEHTSELQSRGHLVCRLLLEQ